MSFPIPPADYTTGWLLSFRATTHGYSVAVCNDDGSPISGGGGGSSSGTCFPLTGSTTALAVFGSATLFSYTVPSTPTAFRGFNGFGDMYGQFFVKLNGLTIFSKELNAANPTPSFLLPQAMALSTGDTVELDVKNVGYQAGDYTGTLLFTNNF